MKSKLILMIVGLALTVGVTACDTCGYGYRGYGYGAYGYGGYYGGYAPHHYWAPRYYYGPGPCYPY